MQKWQHKPMKPKYKLLYSWLLTQQKEEINLSFDDVAVIVDGDLPKSAYLYKSWWANNDTNKSQVQAWKTAGYKSCNLSIPNQLITFRKVR